MDVAASIFLPLIFLPVRREEIAMPKHACFCGAEPAITTRRDFFADAVFGLGAVALADLLVREGYTHAADGPPVRKHGLHHEARATRLIHVFLGGGLSQVDSFDY